MVSSTKTFTLWVSLLLIVVIACGKSDGNSKKNPIEKVNTYFSTMASLTLEVMYEPGAEPYVGNGFQKPLWDFLKINLTALFKDRSLKPSISVPTTLEEMTAVANQTKDVWTILELYGFIDKHRQQKSTLENIYMPIVFLDGYLADEDGSADTSVLGVNITDSPFIAIFKPVIEKAGEGSLPFVSKYIEQATLIHEVGHALGLVENGVPQASEHHDSAHGAHCSVTHCVMYWQNEGAAAARQFVIQVIKTGNEVIFGNECLEDTNNFQPK